MVGFERKFQWLFERFQVTGKGIIKQRRLLQCVHVQRAWCPQMSSGISLRLKENHLRQLAVKFNPKHEQTVSSSMRTSSDRDTEVNCTNLLLHLKGTCMSRMVRRRPSGQVSTGKRSQLGRSFTHRCKELKMAININPFWATTALNSSCYVIMLVLNFCHLSRHPAHGW